ncbi:MAG: multicopper oxidase family protein [Pseudomonadota bacterium]
MAGLKRRDILLGATGLGAAALAGPLRGVANATPKPDFKLQSQMTSYAFGDRPLTDGLFSTVAGGPPPVIRLKQNVEATLRLENGLKDHTTMHWHGIRLPNEMDGVPYLTQMPVATGKTFDYTFTPPDAGTQWYHPHCATMQQMANGLTGFLIVDEAEDQGFDADIAINLKDFRIGEDGSLRPFFTPRGASRGGTLGNVITANWREASVQEAPSGGLARVRILNSDVTRIHRLALPNLPGRIIAWDGQPVDEDIPWPTREEPLLLGPGQRLDVVFRMPDDEGVDTFIESRISGSYRTIDTIRTVGGSSLKRNIAVVRPLPRNPIAEPVLAEAETREMIFGWSPGGEGSNNGLCGTYGFTFWSIDRNPWPGDAVEGVGPVAVLEQGKSYVLRLRNESPNAHPIHLHGLVFKPIRSDQRRLPANYTDTLLLLKGETVDIALRADNPGNWAFHCHIIEHQKTGLSGYIQVV